MNSLFGPSQIGTVISYEQFATIEKICYEGVNVISDAEDRFMTAVAIIAFVPISLLACGRIVVLGVRKHHTQSRIYVRMAVVLQGKVAQTSSGAGVLARLDPFASLWAFVDSGSGPVFPETDDGCGGKRFCRWTVDVWPGSGRDCVRACAGRALVSVQRTARAGRGGYRCVEC
jgi:hypothetical protein